MDIDESTNDRAEEEESSEDEHQPPPAPAVPHRQTFGDDPSTFPDPTVYEIRRDTAGLTRGQLKEIYSVSYFPKHSLDNLIAGDPPDKDFSNAKPTNQVQANTFATYLEPYFRPYTEEDLAFLRERGDRTNAFVVRLWSMLLCAWTRPLSANDGKMYSSTASGRFKTLRSRNASHIRKWPCMSSAVSLLWC